MIDPKLKINPLKTKSWKKLNQLKDKYSNITIKDLFQKDLTRYEQWNFSINDIHIDFSKNLMDHTIFNNLLSLAEESKLKSWIDLMWDGAAINETENRPVLHIALRNQKGKIKVNGKDVMPEVKAVLGQMKEFCERIHKGKHKGYTGKKINTIVNIGIGGSDLGPVMVTEALKHYWDKGIHPHFVSNVDGTQIEETLKLCDPETTLFLIASKTFTTQETMTNAATARDWFLRHAQKESYIKKHFVALSTNKEAVSQFGIDTNNMFAFWDWVGGRYSLWSSIGLSIALTIGFERFEDLLKGAFIADQHFKTKRFDQNIPVIMALVGIWNCNFLKADTEAILPYDQYMHRFPAYFQQGNMESNGKYVDRSGHKVQYQTGPVIWGEPGTNGQHAFYQLIHQGSFKIPCDFIVPAISHNPVGDHHKKLLSNFFAQTQALAFGKTWDEVKTEMIQAGYQTEDIKRLAPYKVFEGNRPTNSFLIKEITPSTLGSLIALYEHKIFVQGVIWNIFSFDQWGVEYGKQLANKILPELNDKKRIEKFDSSTNGLINLWKKIK